MIEKTRHFRLKNCSSISVFKTSLNRAAELPGPAGDAAREALRGRTHKICPLAEFIREAEARVEDTLFGVDAIEAFARWLIAEMPPYRCAKVERIDTTEVNQ